MLAKIVESSVLFDPENGRVIVRSRATVGDMSEVELHQALEAMEVSFLNTIRFQFFTTWEKPIFE